MLIGPETHRYHHSATDSANFGTVTTVWDQLFGTFRFCADPPARLGLFGAHDYPDPEHFHHVLAWPLRRSRPDPSTPEPVGV